MTLLHYFQAGGFMMYPLLLCSIVAVAIALERYRFFKAHHSDTDLLRQAIPERLTSGDTNGLIKLLEQDGGIPATVILQALQQLHTRASQTALIESAAAQGAGQYRNYLNYLSALVTLSPLLGLLGTVIGMISAFDILSIAGGKPFAITGGVAEALVCTAAGLIVAIAAFIFYTYFQHRLDQEASSIEVLSGIYLAIVEGEKR